MPPKKEPCSILGDGKDTLRCPAPFSEEVDEALWCILDLQSKKGHIPYWSALGSSEEDKDTAERHAARCWAEEMNERGWRTRIDTIRPNRGQTSKKSGKPVKLDRPGCDAVTNASNLSGRTL